MTRSELFPALALILSLAAAPAAADVVINEIMYNTPGSPDVEYVELLNTGPGPVDLTGWYVLDDDDLHTRCFLDGTLNADEYLVVAGSIADFTAAHPSVTNVNVNEFGAGFGLGNTSDDVRLFDAADGLVDNVPYTDGAPWPNGPDGNGPSLELVNPVLDNTLPSSWSAGISGGTPGAQNSAFVSDPPPLISGVQRNILLPKSFQQVAVTAAVTDDQSVALVELFVDTGGGFLPTAMLDNGLNGDGAAGDGVFGLLIGPFPSGTVVRYYVSATDTFPQTATEPPTAPLAFFAFTSDYELPPLRINEILASNQTGVFDGAGDRDDWVEIRNTGPGTVDLTGMFLTEDLSDTLRWQLPSVLVAPGASVLIWCDDEPIEGPFHATFRLSRSGGEIGLYDSVDHGNVLIHGYTFGLQSPDVSFGFLPDDADRPDYLVPPTPIVSNDSAAFFSSVAVNEFFAAGGQPDWVELYNRGTLTVDLGNWTLTDDLGVVGKYTFPPLTLIAPGGYLSLDETTLGFNLSASGNDVLMLTAPDGETGHDYVDFGPQVAGTSFGRLPDGSADWQVFSPPTQDLANACNPAIPALAPVGNLRFDAPDALAWDAVPGASAYDAIRGDLATLQASGGDFAVAVSGCAGNNRSRLDLFVPDSPATGSVVFYLVRGVDSACALGSYESGSGTQIGSRSPEIAAAAAACP